MNFPQNDQGHHAQVVGLSELPDEVYLHVMSYLGPPDVGRFRQASRSANETAKAYPKAALESFRRAGTQSVIRYARCITPNTPHPAIEAFIDAAKKVPATEAARAEYILMKIAERGNNEHCGLVLAALPSVANVSSPFRQEVLSMVFKKHHDGNCATVLAAATNTADPSLKPYDRAVLCARIAEHGSDQDRSAVLDTIPTLDPRFRSIALSAVVKSGNVGHRALVEAQLDSVPNPQQIGLRGDLGAAERRSGRSARRAATRSLGR